MVTVAGNDEKIVFTIEDCITHRAEGSAVQNSEEMAELFSAVRSHVSGAINYT